MIRAEDAGCRRRADSRLTMSNPTEVVEIKLQDLLVAAVCVA